MADRILIHRIAVFAHHGVLAEEERLGQRFHISLDCCVDLAAAGASDDVGQTVSYADLTEAAIRVASERRFGLIEALAQAIADEILTRFPKLETVKIRVDKPSAPVPAILDGVSVEIVRSRTARAAG